MAKNKNKKNEGRVTAGDLFDRLKPKNAAGVGEDGKGSAEYSENGFSIDATSGGNSDSELDINDLLKKYMPEYGEKDGAGEGTGVLSGLKQSMRDPSAEELDDERFSSALDSAFGPEDGEELPPLDFPEDLAAPASEEIESYEKVFEDDVKKSDAKAEKKKKHFSLFGRQKKEKKEAWESEAVAAPETEEEKASQAFAEELIDILTTGAPGTLDEASTGEIERMAPSAPPTDVNCNTTDIRLGDLAELETILNDTTPDNRITPDTKRSKPADGDLLKRLEALELETEAAEDAANPAAPAEETPVVQMTEEAGFEGEAAIAAEELFREGAETLPEVTEDAAEASEETAEEGTAAEEIDPTDLNLRVAFGLDDDDKKAESQAAKEFGDKLEERQYKREKRVKLDRPEFVDKTQIPKIRKEYKSRLIALWIKLGLSLIFALILMWFENITFFTELFTGSPKQFAGVFDPAVYPVVYVMTSLQLMLLACICAYEQILDGFKYIFRGIPKAESALSVMTAVGVIYSAVLARVIQVPTEPVMFNFVVALAAVLSLVYAIYNTKREKMNFEIVSAKKPKHIVRRLPDEESVCEAQAFMEQTDACDVMKIEKTDFIDGFFGRLHKPDGAVNVFMTFLLSIAAAIGILVGFFVGLRGGNGAEILSAGFVTMLIAAPTSIFVAFSYPFYRANVAAKEYESAIVGEASLTEYSNASIISFDDKNVFPSYSVKIQNIKIFNNARVDRVLYYAASVFAYAGGPLQDVFEVTTLDMGHSEDVKIFDTEAGFLATQVNGVNIIFGNYRTLTQKGFDIPVEYASDDVDFTSELSVMYMFREDKLVAKMYIKYVMDGDIDLILKQFQGTGLYVCVRTFDPNIDERMIARKLNMRKIPLKVVRYASTEEVTMYEEKVDSGLVTSASPKSLLQIISYCDKVLHTRKAHIALSVLSVIIGIAIVGLMILSDSMGLLNSLFVALYHLLWVVPMVISAKMFIR